MQIEKIYLISIIACKIVAKDLGVFNILYYLQTHLSSVFVPSTKNSQMAPQGPELSGPWRMQGPEILVESIMRVL